MHRWYHVRGVPGRLVGHPEQPSGRRFIGKREKHPDSKKVAIAAGGAGCDDLFDEIEEVVREDATQHVAKAIAAGDLEKIAGPKTAVDHAQARIALAVKDEAPPTQKPAAPAITDAASAAPADSPKTDAPALEQAPATTDAASKTSRNRS